MIIPSRTTRRGGVVPAFQIDDEFAEQVLARKWTLNGHGYPTAQVDGKCWYLHRFVWHIRHGGVPPILDHINEDPLDNRLANLRPATKALNKRNCRHGRRKFGLPSGVYFQADKALPYRAQITTRGRRRHLGYYRTSEEASAAYELARAEQIEKEAAVAAAANAA